MQITTNARSLATSYEAAPALLASNVRRALKTIGGRLVRAARAKVAQRSGRLRRQIRQRIELEPGTKTAAVRVYAGTWYGGIQERGGVVRPTRGQFLAIPLPAAQDGAGGRLMTARQFLTSPEAYGFRTGFIHGRTILGKRGEADAELVPLFALRQAVTIRPQWFLRNALHQQRDRITVDLRGEIDEALAQVAKGRATASGGLL